VTFYAEIIVPTDVFDAIADQAQKTPKLMQTAVNRATSRLRTRILKELRTVPPPPKYPLRWKSKRQERYVKWKLRKEGNLPYQRSGELPAGWKVEHIPQGDNGGLLSVSNDVPYAQFVSGDWSQPYHLDSGWVQAANVVSGFRVEAENILIETWGTVALDFGGVFR